MKPLVETTFIEYNPEISPDGRYLAYQSNESGREEIYVRPFPNVNGGRWQASTGSGTRPAWARNGRELFYLDLSNRLTATAVPVQTSGATFAAGNPANVFDTTYVAPNIYFRTYDVSPDGQAVPDDQRERGRRSERDEGRHGRRAQLARGAEAARADELIVARSSAGP